MLEHLLSFSVTRMAKVFRVSRSGFYYWVENRRAPELIEVINQHSLYVAEMKEWNAMTHQAHMLLHLGQF